MGYSNSMLILNGRMSLQSFKTPLFDWSSPGACFQTAALFRATYSYTSCQGHALFPLYQLALLFFSKCAVHAVHVHPANSRLQAHPLPPPVLSWSEAPFPQLVSLGDSTKEPIEVAAKSQRIPAE